MADYPRWTCGKETNLNLKEDSFRDKKGLKKTVCYVIMIQIYISCE